MKKTTIQHRIETRRDPSTGRTVRRLTSLPGNHHHLYFTSTSFVADGRHVLYIGDDGEGRPNLYRLSLEDGSAVQLTDNRGGAMRSYVYYDGQVNAGLAKASPSYDPATNRLLYIQDNEVRLLDVGTLEEETLLRLPDDVVTGFTHLSGDGRYAAVPVIDAEAFRVGAGNPFSRIRENVAAKGLRSRMLLLDTREGRCETLFEQEGWITHVQFHPLDDGRLLYNHEGGMVQQRIWLYDRGVIRKVREQPTDERDALWICHEMWTADGGGVLYHGTTGVPNDPAMRELSRGDREIVSFVGCWDAGSGRYAEIAFPPEMDAYGHFTSDPTGGRLVTDGVIDARSIHVVQPDWAGGKVGWRKLCEHGSSFRVQDVHPHPIFSPDGRSVLFTSDAENEWTKGHLYLVDAAEEADTV